MVSSSIILHVTALRQGLSPKWKLIILARLTDQGSPRTHLFLSLQSWGFMHDEIMSDFSMWVLEIWTQTWVLGEQPYLLTESSLQSLNHFEGITFFFLDEIAVGASFSHEARLSLPILWQHLGGMAQSLQARCSAMHLCMKLGVRDRMSLCLDFLTCEMIIGIPRVRDHIVNRLSTTGVG